MKIRNERVPSRGKVTVTHISPKTVIDTDGRLKDIGPKGFSYVSETAPAYGVLHEFRLDIDGGALKLKAKAMGIKKEQIQYSVDVIIQSMSFFDRARLNRFLVSQEKRFGSSVVLYAMVGFAVTCPLLCYVFGVSWTYSLIGAFFVGMFQLVYKPFL